MALKLKVCFVDDHGSIARTGRRNRSIKEQFTLAGFYYLSLVTNSVIPFLTLGTDTKVFFAPE